MLTIQTDFVVVGCGLAGSTAAYGLSQLGEVALLSKGTVSDTNSFAAQGGIAAATGQGDSPQLHHKDTLAAGAGLCHSDFVAELVKEAPCLMKWLQDLGVPFDCDDSGGVKLGLEGAHSRSRIWHAGGDATGRKVMETLSAKLPACTNLQSYASVYVTNLVKNAEGRVIGVVGWQADSTAGENSPVLSKQTPGFPKQAIPKQILWLAKRGVVLATGGLGRLFPHTSNPAAATGDGFALAYDAGAELRNMEFVQFHPTILQSNQGEPLLISEAVRGAGAQLIDKQGRAIMKTPSDNLGPRDVVARVIYRQSLEKGQIYLDTTVVKDFPIRFPTIYESCLKYGYNPTQFPIPVSPAAHFMMGGVTANLAGETTVEGLYAIGETASTGIHGANRLASNSLLECLGMGFQLVRHFQNVSSAKLDYSRSEVESANHFIPDKPSFLHSIQKVLWESAGIVREETGLRSGLNQVAQMQAENPQSPAACVAALILSSALHRRESRGAHYRLDFPNLSPLYAKDSILVKTDTSGTLEPVYA